MPGAFALPSLRLSAEYPLNGPGPLSPTRLRGAGTRFDHPGRADDRADPEAARAPQPSPQAEPPPPARGGAGGGAADEIVPEAAEESGSAVVVRRSTVAPARSTAAAQDSAVASGAAAAEAAAAADRRLELLTNQLGRIALAVSGRAEPA